VLKTHTAWRTQYEAYKKAIDEAQEERERYLHGNLIEVQQSEPSIRSLRAELARVVTDRGRVWRECAPIAAVDADTFRVRTVPANLPPGTTPEPNGIAPQTILYAFAEAENEAGWKVPVTYLGEFSVDAATPTEVTISATLPLDPDQRQRITQGRTTWTLYEIMPLDGHEIFAEWDPDQKMLVGLEKEELAKYIPNQFNWPSERYDRFIDQFYRFNREATEDDPPENVWVQVKFVKAHSIQVDSDVVQSLLEGDGRYFDSSGRAVEGRLQRGEDGTVRFEVGDTGVFDQQTADTLIADGVCEKVKLVYRRPLHDYQQFFRSAFHRFVELDETIAHVQRNIDTLTSTKALADEQIAYRTQEKINLEKDLAGFRREQAEVTNYARALEAAWTKTLQQLSWLYVQNNKLAEELKALQFRMAEQINRRTLAATARAASPSGAPTTATPPASSSSTSAPPARAPAATSAPTTPPR